MCEDGSKHDGMHYSAGVFHGCFYSVWVGRALSGLGVRVARAVGARTWVVCAVCVLSTFEDVVSARVCADNEAALQDAMSSDKNALARCRSRVPCLSPPRLVA